MEEKSPRISRKKPTTRRGEKTSRKKGGIKKEETARKYSYSLTTMAISLKQIMISGNSLRGVERNWLIEKEEKEGNESEKTPGYSRVNASYFS